MHTAKMPQQIDAPCSSKSLPHLCHAQMHAMYDTASHAPINIAVQSTRQRSQGLPPCLVSAPTLSLTTPNVPSRTCCALTNSSANTVGFTTPRYSEGGADMDRPSCGRCPVPRCFHYLPHDKTPCHNPCHGSEPRDLFMTNLHTSHVPALNNLLPMSSVTPLACYVATHNTACAPSRPPGRVFSQSA